MTPCAPLTVAQQWRQRLGLRRDPKWDHVIANLPPLTIRDGLYVAAETATHTFTEPGKNTSHPCMLAPLGMLNGAMVDPAIMRKTMRNTPICVTKPGFQAQGQAEKLHETHEIMHKL